MSVATEERAVPQTSWLYDPKVRSLIVQGLLLGLLVWMAYEIVQNTAANLARLNRISAGAFSPPPPVSTSSSGRSPTATYRATAAALVIGFLNTLIVAALGIVAATVLGFMVGIMRLSRNFVIPEWPRSTWNASAMFRC